MYGTRSCPAARHCTPRSRRSYRPVVEAEACPAIFWTVARSTPASSRSPVQVRRRSWGARGWIPALRHAPGRSPRPVGKEEALAVDDTLSEVDRVLPVHALPGRQVRSGQEDSAEHLYVRSLARTEDSLPGG